MAGRAVGAGALVLDVGGVLTTPEGPLPQLAAALDLPPDAVAAAYWGPRDGYDRGGPAAAYWRAVGEALGRDLTGRCAEVLDAVDARGWAEPAPGAAALLEEVAAAAAAGGVRLAVLSNAPASTAGAVRAARWSQPFEALVFSCDLRAAKPEPAAYAAVERALGLAGGALLFLDDRPANVAAARERGWRAHRWVGADAARQLLVAEGVLAGWGGPAQAS